MTTTQSIVILTVPVEKKREKDNRNLKEKGGEWRSHKMSKQFYGEPDLNRDKYDDLRVSWVQINE